jgi:hypothetical protein
MAERDDLIRLLLPGIMCNDAVIVLRDAAVIEAAPAGAAATPGDLEMGFTDEMDGTEDAKQPTDIADGAPDVAAPATTAPYITQGDPTESCILDLAVQLLGAPQAVKQFRRRHRRRSEIPFDSAHKYMVTLHTLTAELAQRLQHRRR